MISEHNRNLSDTATVHCKLPRRGLFFGAQSPKKRSPFIMESMFFLARYFSIVPFGLLSMRVWWPCQKNRTWIPFFGSGYAGLGIDHSVTSQADRWARFEILLAAS